ncbi:phosphotransferase [Leucobacter sp. GX24907]
MPTTPLTLAALATSAVPGLVVQGVRDHVGDGDGAFASAVLVSADDDLIVRVPRTQAAEVQQSAELLSLSALASGARSRLPFAVSEPRGVTRAGDTRAVVSTFLHGDRLVEDTIEPDALIIDSIAAALAAIHELPHVMVRENGLPTRSSEDSRIEAARLVERAEATRLLPETVLNRWIERLRESELWDFAPTVVHGSLNIEQLLVIDDTIVGVLGWSELSVGDPAIDLAWLRGSGDATLEQVLLRYAEIRGLGSTSRLWLRTAFYHELEVAKWLLHGVESHDQTVVEDAVAMLDRLVDRGASRRESARHSAAPLNEAEVDDLLDSVPEVNDLMSDTAAYEALDEDRVFRLDTDFIEPLDDTDDSASGSHDGAGQGSSADGGTDADADSDMGADADSGSSAAAGSGTDTDAGSNADAGSADGRHDQDSSPEDSWPEDRSTR